MAVQQNRKSRSRRDMRRSHDALTENALTVDQATGETHRRHHVSKDGIYRAYQVCSHVFLRKHLESVRWQQVVLELF